MSSGLLAKCIVRPALRARPSLLATNTSACRSATASCLCFFSSGTSNLPPALTTQVNKNHIEPRRESVSSMTAAVRAAGIATVGPPNQDMDAKTDKEGITILDLSSQKPQHRIPWKQLSSVAICVDGPRQMKFWHLCKADGTFIDVPLSIPSQEGFARRLERLPGFQMVCHPFSSIRSCCSARLFLLLWIFFLDPVTDVHFSCFFIADRRTSSSSTDGCHEESRVALGMG